MPDSSGSHSSRRAPDSEGFSVGTQPGGAAKAETHGSAALDAVVAGGIPAQRTSLAALLDRFPLVAGAAEAVVARGIKTQRAASTTFLNGAAGVAPGAGHAVAAGAVVAKRAASHFGQRLHRLLG